MTKNPKGQSEKDLLARAASLHFTFGMTQGDVAQELGISSAKAHRLITRAMQSGMVKILVESELRECINLERALKNVFNLKSCLVAPFLEGTGTPLSTLSNAGAVYLQSLVEAKGDAIVALAGGQTLAAAIDALPTTLAPNATIVSVTGSIYHARAGKPHETVHRLAGKIHADAYNLTAPVYGNSPVDRDVIRKQSGVKHVLELIQRADVIVMGIGHVETVSSVTEGSVTAQEHKSLLSGGAVAEFLAHFLDIDGNLISTPLNERIIGPSLDEVRDKEVVAIAGGPKKVQPIRAALRSGLLTELITDEVTARNLLEA